MGHGPTLIDCQIDLSNPGDPILNMQNYLTRKGLFTDGFKAEVEARFKKELDASI
jgi:TPP-dependent pyruvate/acetoin dehydrogenase alpha subunit